ncbi:Mitosis inhibitor protein kinase wee1 [Termitomyces sp. J132]|nr:hypothetical protein H2248_004752 [Termitomyces sp. 'cryptogamus']KNZ72880.1 Mitosis inhibitor protein kinase wee1 [Termitomyces sp. J132]
MIASTPSKDYLALRTSPSYRPRHCTPPRRVESPTTDLPSYDSPMLTPSPLRQQPLFSNPFNPLLADPDDFFLQSPFKSPAPAHHLHTVYASKPQPIPSDDDDGSIFLSSSSSYSPFFPTSTSQPLRTPVKQVHRFSNRTALSVKQLNSMPTPLDAFDSATRVGVGTKRKSTTSTPIRQHNLTPLVISSQRVCSGSASDAVMLDRLAPLPAPKFVASTPQSKAETEAHLKRQTATLTRLKLSDFGEPRGDLDVDDSGCEMGEGDRLFSGSQDRSACKGKGKEKEEVAEAISPGGHVIKRRARRRPRSAELLESVRSSSSPTKATMVATSTQRQRNSGITFPSAPHSRKRTTSGSSSSDVDSPAPRRRVNNTRPCPPKLTSVPPVASRLSINRQDSATLFFGPAIPQASNSVPTSRSRANSSLSVSVSEVPATNAARKTNRHSYAGAGASNLQAWNTIQTRDPSPSPKSSPPAGSLQFGGQDDDDDDMFFGGGPQDSSFVFSVTEGTPSPRTKKMKRSTLQSKYKPRDSGIALDDEHEAGTDCLNVMPGTSTSVGSIHSDIEDNLVTPGTGPEAGSEWPRVFVTGADDPTSREGLDVDAFIMRTLAVASKNPEGKKKVPGTPVKKVKKTYLPAGQRAWQSAVAIKVGPRVDFEPKRGNGPRKSLPAKLPLNFDTDSDDEDGSPGKRENYAGLGIGRPSASTPYDGNPQTLRARWLMRRSSSGAFSSGSDSMSSSGTPTRPKNKESRVASLTSHMSPLQKNAFKLSSMTRTASNSSSSSTGTLNSPSLASSRRLQAISRPLPVPDTYSEVFAEDQPTSRFERDFEVDSEIGSGEFGKVIKVRCKNGDDSEVYAVKKSKRVEGPRHRLRLQEEVQVLQHLAQVAAASASYEGNRHPNVLAYIDSWEENDALYIQTELCTSGNLQQFLETFGNVYRKLSEDRVWKILVDLSNGLRFVHDAGVIHLDLKPSNIFVTGEGRLRIGDFGMATFLGQFETVTGSKGFEREGDKRYLAPEILQEDYYSKAADIFSLGMTILEAAANIVVPDQGEDWQRLRRDDFSQVLLDDSPELLEIIKQMMRQRPQERVSIHDVCGHGVVCRAREAMERMWDAAKRDTKCLLGASPFGRTEEGFLDEILGRAMDVSA